MGYNNKDKRYVTVSAKEQRRVSKLRRLAGKRETRGEHVRGAYIATRNGWWYA
jgi:hypothetical protein